MPIMNQTFAATMTVLALAASPAAAAPAAMYAGSSAPGPGDRSLSVWAVVDPGPYDGLGVGARYTLPIVPQGVLHSPSVRDEFTLELGTDFVHYSDRIGPPPGPFVDYTWSGFLAVAGGAWNFWFTPRFAAYPKLDVGWSYGWYSRFTPLAPGYTRASFDGLFVQGALGAIYRFDRVALRLEAGSGLVRAGVGISL
jgi:hypothetical protein